MRQIPPQRLDRHTLLLEHGFNLKSTCQHCGGKLIECDGEVYISIRGWMCEACFMGDQRLHCCSRPFQRPVKRPRG